MMPCFFRLQSKESRPCHKSCKSTEPSETFPFLNLDDNSDNRECPVAVRILAQGYCVELDIEQDDIRKVLLIKWETERIE